MINKDKIDLIKSTYDIIDVIGEFVKLKKKGSNYVGLSPFNNERTPSFMVNPAKNIFKDFSSGKGGDIIEFLMQLLKINYYEAIVFLAKKYKIDIDSDFTFEYEPLKKAIELPTSYIETEEMLQTLNVNSENALYKFMCDKFTDGITEDKFLEYNIGFSINDWIIFWQVDLFNKVRSGKYIKYKLDGHRDKDTNASWHHAKTKEYRPVYPNFNLVQCFFGEHLLLNDIKKPVAIVESEKTALVASIYMDKYIWLACGSKHGLNDIKCKALANRSVTLFPDLGAYDEWKIKARYYGYNISNHVENIANDTERKNGLDLADFLLR